MRRFLSSLLTARCSPRDGASPHNLIFGRLAWLSPSCHALYRRLRILDLGMGRDSPLSLPAAHIRPERHVENSIATIRKRLTVALAKSLARCPCCHSTPQPPATRSRL